MCSSHPHLLFLNVNCFFSLFLKVNCFFSFSQSELLFLFFSKWIAFSHFFNVDCLALPFLKKYCLFSLNCLNRTDQKYSLRYSAWNLEKYRWEIQFEIQDESLCVTVELIDVSAENFLNVILPPPLILNNWTFLIFYIWIILKVISS